MVLAGLLASPQARRLAGVAAAAAADRVMKRYGPKGKTGKPKAKKKKKRSAVKRRKKS